MNDKTERNLEIMFDLLESLSGYKKSYYETSHLLRESRKRATDKIGELEYDNVLLQKRIKKLNKKIKKRKNRCLTK